MLFNLTVQRIFNSESIAPRRDFRNRCRLRTHAKLRRLFAKI
jgi:hypothetical protein